MVRLKRALVGGIGIAIGIVTLRRFRRRRRDPRQEAEAAAKDALAEATEAAEHSAASVEHARIAGEKAVEATSDELETVRGTVADRGSADDSRKRGIRRRARGLLRR